jgi:hypothetical protein
VLPRSSTSAKEQYPTGELKIYDSLHGDKSAYNDVMNLLIEHIGYAWAYRGYADQRDGDEGKASMDAPMVDSLSLAGSGDGSRRGGSSAGPNASMNRRPVAAAQTGGGGVGGWGVIT